MFYISDLTSLLSIWQERAHSSAYSDDYQKAVSQCTAELESAFSFLIQEDIEARKHLEEQFARELLSGEYQIP